MAQGDILDLKVSSFGWAIEGLVSGFYTGGFFNMGFTGTSGNILSNPKFVVTLTSSGFTNGSAVETQRTIYGTTGMRKPYPDQADKDVQSISGGSYIKIVLNDFIYSKDKNISVTILSGLYVASGLPSISGTFTNITNTATGDYPKARGNWSMVPFQQMTGSTFDLRCVAFSHYAQSGKMVDSVNFILNDTSGNTVSGLSTSPIVDSEMLDAVPVIEYKKSLSITGLGQGLVCSGNFEIYPRIGDSGSVLKTNDGVNTGLHPRYTTINFLCDKSGTYGRTVVVVNQQTGSNASGVTVDFTGFNSGSPPRAYASIASGAKAIQVYNNANRGRNDVGGGIIYLQSGTYAWLGNSAVGGLYGNTPNTWITITNFPTDNIENIVITGTSGNTDISDRVKLENITITGSGQANIFSNINALWFNKCNIGYSGNGMVTSCRNWYNTINNYYRFTQGVQSSTSADITHPVLTRGNNFSFGFNATNFIYTTIGNLHTGSGNALVYKTATNGQQYHMSANPIFAFNKILNHTNDNVIAEFGRYFSETGVVIVQNILENARESNNQALVDIGSSDGVSINNPLDEFIVWHNTFVGQRQFYGYNDTSFKWRRNWSTKFNIFDCYANKTDVFGAGDGTRTGNWSINFGTHSVGNIFVDTIGVIPGNVGGFHNYFDGLNCIAFPSNNRQSSPSGTGPTGFLQFVNRASVFNNVNNTGNGDYSYLSTSPAINLSSDIVLPYDILGIARVSPYNAAGAYSFPAIISMAVNTRRRIILI